MKSICFWRGSFNRNSHELPFLTSLLHLYVLAAIIFWWPRSYPSSNFKNQPFQLPNAPFQTGCIAGLKSSLCWPQPTLGFVTRKYQELKNITHKNDGKDAFNFFSSMFFVLLFFWGGGKNIELENTEKNIPPTQPKKMGSFLIRQASELSSRSWSQGLWVPDPLRPFGRWKTVGKKQPRRTGRNGIFWLQMTATKNK